jgi:hypothetical protein
MKIDNIQLGTKEFNDLASAYFGGNPKRQTAKANIQSMANWWREPKKISCAKDKGGSFNMQLYLDYLSVINNLKHNTITIEQHKSITKQQ